MNSAMINYGVYLCRGKNQRANVSYREANGSNGANNLAFEVLRDLREQHHTSSDKAAESIEPGAALSSVQEPMKLAGQAVAKKVSISSSSMLILFP